MLVVAVVSLYREDSFAQHVTLRTERFLTSKTAGAVGWLGVAVPIWLGAFAEDAYGAEWVASPWFAELVDPSTANWAKTGYWVTGQIMGTPGAFEISAQRWSATRPDAPMASSHHVGSIRDLGYIMDVVAQDLFGDWQSTRAPNPIVLRDPYAMDLYTRALVAHHQNNLRSARRYLLRALAIEPELYWAKVALGHLTAEDPSPRISAQAGAWFLEALASAPESVVVQRSVARTTAVGHPDEIGRWRTWAERQPWSEEAAKGLAFSLLRQRNFQEVIPLLATLSERAPVEDVFMALVEAHVELGNLPAAAAALDRLLATTPSNRAFDLGSVIAERRGDRFGAALMLATSVGARPNDAEVSARVGDLLSPDPAAAAWYARAGLLGAHPDRLHRGTDDPVAQLRAVLANYEQVNSRLIRLHQEANTTLLFQPCAGDAALTVWRDAIDAANVAQQQVGRLALATTSRWLLPSERDRLERALAGATELAATQRLAQTTTRQARTSNDCAATLGDRTARLSSDARAPHDAVKTSILVDNRACNAPARLILDGVMAAKVQPRELQRVTVPAYERTVCLLFDDGQRCGDAGTVRSGWLFEGWTMIATCQ